MSYTIKRWTIFHMGAIVISKIIRRDRQVEG